MSTLRYYMSPDKYTIVLIDERNLQDDIATGYWVDCYGGLHFAKIETKLLKEWNYMGYYNVPSILDKLKWCWKILRS